MKTLFIICLIGSALIVIQETSWIGKSGVAMVITGLAIITGILSYGLYRVWDKH